MIPGTPLKTPILFLIFNRPETTRKVFQEIRRARPGKLYIASDGPRVNKDNEKKLVADLREEVTKGVDWDCKVFTLFREANLGCKNAVSGAISWFFDKEEAGIILEDDCLPARSFFPFCEALLEKHRNDENCAGITGDFHMLDSARPSGEYGRISFPLIWGWATWRRVWEMYSPEIPIKEASSMQVPGLAKKKPNTKRFFDEHFQMILAGKDTWDVQFSHLALKKSLYFLHPFRNLISNIGFAVGATNTGNADDPFSALPLKELDALPVKLVNDPAYERWLDLYAFNTPPFPVRVIRRFFRMTIGRDKADRLFHLLQRE